MSTKKTRRGRPKGSGIDDSAPLLQIAALMAEDPDLKPTTAIRRLGISEPSTIRRLRDKFKVFSQEQLPRKNVREKQFLPEGAIGQWRKIAPGSQLDRASF